MNQRRLDNFVNGDGISFSHMGKPVSNEYRDKHDKIFGVKKCRVCKDKGFIYLMGREEKCTNCIDTKSKEE